MGKVECSTSDDDEGDGPPGAVAAMGLLLLGGTLCMTETLVATETVVGGAGGLGVGSTSGDAGVFGLTWLVSHSAGISGCAAGLRRWCALSWKW